MTTTSTQTSAAAEQWLIAHKSLTHRGQLVPDVQWIEQKWIPALLSGEYKQTEGSLRIGEHYCCLGVACDIRRDDFRAIWKRGSGESSYGYSFHNEFGNVDGETSELPNPVAKAIGMSAQSICFPRSFVEVGRYVNASDDQITEDMEGEFYIIAYLASLNDAGWSFVEIADLLRDICNDWRRYAEVQVRNV